MESQKTVTEKGGTMRLGGWDCTLAEGTKAAEAYGKSEFARVKSPAGDHAASNAPLVIRERHRHRYEFNNEFRDKLTAAGLTIAGTTPDNQLVEVIELKDHPFFVAVQFHPEFTSRPLGGHPLFNAFIAAAGK